MRETAVQDVKPISIAEEFCVVHEAVRAKADRIAGHVIDVEPMLPVFDTDEIGAIAIARDLQFAHDVADRDPQRHRECSLRAIARFATAAHEGLVT